ncbi:MAG: hypothetical protein ACREOG_10775 [Gemmatimonadaceae bacterium]
MKATLLFALTTAALALLGAALLAQIFGEPRSSAAVWTSAVLAIAVQIATYGIARRYALKRDVMTGWGIGALIRVTVLVVYGALFFGPWSLGIPLEPALLSFALFVFASTVVEPLFLSR